MVPFNGNGPLDYGGDWFAVMAFLLLVLAVLTLAGYLAGR